MRQAGVDKLQAKIWKLQEERKQLIEDREEAEGKASEEFTEALLSLDVEIGLTKHILRRKVHLILRVR